MFNPRKSYTPFNKEEFLQALADAGLERIEEVESQWTLNRVGIEVHQCKFLARIPGVPGYLSIGSSIDPVSGESNDSACDRITLMLKSLDRKFLRRLNRVQGWRTNLKKAVEALRKQAIASIPKASAPTAVTQGVAA